MSSPVNVGDILGGKYQVERVLGVGGMGVVVSAKHLILGERVAIKFLLPQALAREDVVSRFIKEGMAANRLRGEHIGRVHDVGKLPSGAPYLVMEYLDGKDLGAILRESGPFALEHAVDYVMQACEALAEAHSVGIVHRDLKPSNLFLITRLDGSPSVKLIDFGISKIQLPGSDGAEGEMTATAVMMGSPLYMAPEQMASARDVDGRADIWSLGIILHTMLTGSPPFRAPSVMQIYELIVQGAPPIRKIRADVPEGIEAAILKCLHKDRRQRYGNVGELAAAISEFGPPEARFTADRIKRIITARSTQDSIPTPSGDAVAASTPAAASGRDGARAQTPDAEPAPPSSQDVASAQRDGATRVGAPASDATPPPVDSRQALDPGNVSVLQPGGSSAIDPLGSEGAWDQKTHPPTRRPRPATLVAAAAALLIGAPVAFFALRAQPQRDPVSPVVDSSGAHHAGVTLASADPGQPSVLPGSAVPPSTSATPAAETSAHPAAPGETAKPAASARVRHTPSPGPPHVPRPPPGRSADDLFGTQK